MGDFKGKTAVVTGASNGIGLAICKKAASLGMHVVMADNNEEALSNAEKIVQASGAKTLAVPCDVTVFDEFAALRDKAIQTFGSVELLVNAATSDLKRGVLEASIDEVHSIMRTNLYSVFNGLKAFIPVMRQSGSQCHILTVLSTAAFATEPTDRPFYYISQHAAMGISESVNYSLKLFCPNIAMTILCPDKDISGEEAFEQEADKAFEAVKNKKLFAIDPNYDFKYLKERHDVSLNKKQFTMETYGKENDSFAGIGKLKGKTAVVTGAARGIGLALCKEAAKNKMNVVMADIDMTELRKSEQLIRDMGVETLSVYCDVTKYESVEALRDAAVEKFGSVELLFNNAGVAVLGGITELPPRDFDFCMHVDFFGVLYGLMAFLPQMRKQNNECHIATTASMAAFYGEPGMPSYYAAKRATLALMECANYELRLGKDKIGMTVIAPGMVRTDIAHGDQRRPKDFAIPEDDPYYKSESYLSGIRISEKNTVNSVSPEYIALRAFKHIKKNRLYSFPRDGEGPLQQLRRHMDVAQGRLPDVDIKWFAQFMKNWK